MLRKLIAIIILATMMFSFVGCSDKESTDVIKNENVQDVDNEPKLTKSRALCLLVKAKISCKY